MPGEVYDPLQHMTLEAEVWSRVPTEMVPPSVDRVTRLRMRAVGAHGGMLIDGQLIDWSTAGLLLSIHDGLNEENRARFAEMDVAVMNEVAWRLVEAGVVLVEFRSV